MVNSVLSSTKDNSMNNNNQKKKLFLNPDTQKQNYKNNNKKIITITNNIKKNQNQINYININNNINNDINNNINNNINNDINNNINNNIDINKINNKQKIILPDQSTYEGFLKNNEFEGYGEYKSYSYNYFGEFSSGKKHGKGKMEDFIKSSEYIGDFRNDMKEGYGEEKYKDGSIYKGEFKEDMKDGRGILLLQGNRNYGFEGEFKKDKISGKGKFKWNEQKEYIGEWDNNEISGYGIILEGKMRHVGYFLHNVKDGFGATFYVDQNFALLGKWENDLIEGPAILVNLSENNNTDNILENNNINFDLGKETIVGMSKGEIINMRLEEEDLFKFKNSEDYENMTKLYKEKFFPDYQRYINDNSLY